MYKKHYLPPFLYIFFFVYIARVRICKFNKNKIYNRQTLVSIATTMSFGDYFNPGNRSLGKIILYVIN